jgi:hypothetical protein
MKNLMKVLMFVALFAATFGQSLSGWGAVEETNRGSQDETDLRIAAIKSQLDAKRREFMNKFASTFGQPLSGWGAVEETNCGSKDIICLIFAAIKSQLDAKGREFTNKFSATFGQSLRSKDSGWSQLRDGSDSGSQDETSLRIAAIKSQLDAKGREFTNKLLESVITWPYGLKRRPSPGIYEEIRLNAPWIKKIWPK